MRIELSRFVEGDLAAIGDYIAQDNPTRAISFIQEVRAHLRRIGSNPLLYQLRPEIGEAARMAIVSRYVILFRVVGTVVGIERVVYGGRDLLTVLPNEQGGHTSATSTPLNPAPQTLLY